MKKIIKLTESDLRKIVTKVLNEQLANVVDTPEEIMNFQKELVKLGYNLGRSGVQKNGVDGKIGRLTRGAIAAFQRASKLPVTGKLDQMTQNKIDYADSVNYKASTAEWNNKLSILAQQQKSKETAKQKTNIQTQEKIKKIQPTKKENLPSTNFKSSDQVKKQLMYLKQNGILKDERFTILDDKNSTVYAFNPNYQLYKAYPVITGKEKGDYLKKTSIVSYLTQNPGVIVDALKKGLSKFSFKDFVNHIDQCYFDVDENRIKQTPSGVFKRAGDVINFVNDQFLTAFVEKDYGKRYITFETLDGKVIPYGFHGTGNPERLKKFKLTDKDLMSCKRKMSFGCVNFRESDILEISKFINVGQKSIWLSDVSNDIIRFSDKTINPINRYEKFKAENPRSLDPGKI
jgi:peptidoglycan hydrolase-like protein with peptidoglycan-binding domain